MTGSAMIPPTTSDVDIRTVNESAGCVITSFCPFRYGRIGFSRNRLALKWATTNTPIATPTPRAPMDQIRRHRSSSRWSRKGISSDFLAAINPPGRTRLPRRQRLQTVDRQRRGVAVRILLHHPLPRRPRRRRVSLRHLRRAVLEQGRRRVGALGILLHDRKIHRIGRRPVVLALVAAADA